jgi:hypothetical protein
MRSLELIAQRLRLNLISDGRILHLFTAKKIPPWAFRALLNRYLRPLSKLWLNRRLRGRSLLGRDYERVAGRPLA